MRRKSKKIYCGNIAIGGDSKVSIQSMTNTDTKDVKATLEQIAKMKDAGCEIVRVAIPDVKAANAIREIKSKIDIPLVADIQFDYKLAILAIESGADKIRINPGNIGSTDKVEAITDKAKEFGIPIRIGINGGSLEKDILAKYGKVTAEGIAESALRNIKLIEDMNFDNIIVSIKSSDPALNYEAHMIIANQMNYPLHIGITESGSIKSGKVKSAIGIGALLINGIGDTIRVSLTGDPINEIIFAKQILKGAGVRKEGINIISCPTCARCKVDLDKIVRAVEGKIGPIDKRLEREHETLNVAIMGCEVNGPGEAREADLGIACGKKKAALFKKGSIIKTIDEGDIVKELLAALNKM